MTMPDEKLVARVLDLVERIPAGRVMSYGDVGLAIGVDAPRAIGRVMALYGHGSAWWRVIRADGRPPQGHERLALPHYRAEQTPLVDHADGYRIARSARLPRSHEIFGEVAL